MSVLDPPAHYGPDDPRRAIWTQTVNRLTANGQLFKADPGVLAAYVEQVHTNQRAAQLLTQTDVLIIRDGRAVANPAADLQRRSATAIATLARALGLGKTPIASALEDAPIADPRRWCEDHDRWECKHRRQDGGWCHQWRTVAGTGECRKHGGLPLDQLRAKGAANLARLYGQPRETTPVAALLDEVRWSAGHVDALRAELATLEEGGTPLAGTPPAGGQFGGSSGTLFWGTTKVTTKDGAETERVEEARPHAIVTAYNLERLYLAKVAHAAISAGAQQEAVDVAKALGAGLGLLLDAIFDALFVVPPDLERAGPAELIAWQRRQVPQVVPAIMRSMSAGPEAGVS